MEIKKRETKRPDIHDVWKLPFYTDAEWDPYIWSKDGYPPVFTWAIRDGKSKETIVKILNGERKPSGRFTCRLEKAVYVVATEKETGAEFNLGLVRGWGYLHGIGGLHLDLDVAEKVHEEFCQWFVDRLNGKV